VEKLVFIRVKRQKTLNDSIRELSSEAVFLCFLLFLSDHGKLIMARFYWLKCVKYCGQESDVPFPVGIKQTLHECNLTPHLTNFLTDILFL